MTIDEIVALAGGAQKLAEIAGVHRASVYASWRRTGRIPVERAHAISAALGIPLHKIRPDVWPPADPQPAQAQGEAEAA